MKERARARDRLTVDHEKIPSAESKYLMNVLDGTVLFFEWVGLFGICDPLVNGIDHLAKNGLYNWARTNAHQRLIESS